MKRKLKTLISSSSQKMSNSDSLLALVGAGDVVFAVGIVVDRVLVVVV